MATMDSIGTPFHPLIQQEWNFLRLSRIEKCTFPSESIRFQWIRWTPSERLSTPSSNMSGIFLSLSRIENELFHRNVFVSNASNALGRTLHHQTSGFPMESKGLRLDSGRQYWTTLHVGWFIGAQTTKFLFFCKNMKSIKSLFPQDKFSLLS